MNSNFIYLNGKWQQENLIPLVLPGKEIAVYEVIRVIEGIPLFLDEHIERLEKSAEFSGFQIQHDTEMIKQIIGLLIKKNNQANANIQVLFNKPIGINQSFVYRFIPSYYPKKEEYDSGVKSMLFRAVRHNPAIKKTNQSLRDATDEAIKNNKVFEVILVDEKGRLTEGSRSNIFFIQAQDIITPPAQNVLQGITRTKTIQICKKNSISLIERPIKTSNLAYFDAAFFTGTSPKILPVSSIDEFSFDPSNIILKKIMRFYDEEIEFYINKWQSPGS